MDVGIIGGTGPAGRALAARLAASGSSVVLGSRDAARGQQAAADLVAAWPGRELDLTGGSNEDAARRELVVLATPYEAAAEAAISLSDALAGRVVVSMVNAIARVGRELQAVLPARGSVAATLQSALPRSELSAAFHHLPARELGLLDGELDSDVLVCADTERAGEATVALVESVPGLRGVLAGSLAAAGPVEALTAVLVNVNVRYRSHVALKLSGLRRDRA
ncbi:MAG: NADPH-dependent F420 reductase [Actinomycetota bacterium]|nr:NADPH-dependent F420 reductase [Actinomycetota bacterium]